MWRHWSSRPQKENGDECSHFRPFHWSTKWTHSTGKVLDIDGALRTSCVRFTEPLDPVVVEPVLDESLQIIGEVGEVGEIGDVGAELACMVNACLVKWTQGTCRRMALVGNCRTSDGVRGV